MNITLFRANLLRATALLLTLVVVAAAADQPTIRAALLARKNGTLPPSSR